MKQLAKTYLKKSEKYLKTDIVYLIRGSSWLSLGNIIAGISGLLLTFGLVKILDKTEYGTYSYIMSISNIVGALTITGMATSIIRAVAHNYDGTLIKAVWLRLRWSIPASVGSLIFAGYYIFKDNTVLGYALIAVALLTPLMGAFALYGPYFNGKKDFKALVLKNTIRAIVTTALVLVVAYITRDVFFVILTFLLASTIMNGFFFYQLFRKMRNRDQIDERSISFGKHFSVMNILTSVSNYADRILMFQFIGAAELAAYSIAQAPVKEMTVIAKMSRTLGVPKFSKRSVADIKKNMLRKMFLASIASVAMLLTYILLSPFLFDILFPEYQESILLTQLLAASLLFIPFNLLSQVLIAHEAHEKLYVWQVSLAFSKLLLLILLVPIYGALGAIVSILGSHLITTPLLIYLFIKLK